MGKLSLLVCATAVAATARAAAPPGGSLAPLVEKLSPAVVNVQAVQIEHGPGDGLDEFFHRFFGGERGESRRALGSGFVVDAGGLVVTNFHVVKDAADVKVRLSDGREFKGDVVGRDPKTDLALVRLRGARGLPTVQLGDSDKLRVGDPVVAIGNPFGLGNTVTSGIVSAKERVVGAGPYDDFIQTDASINPGNSGGPLFDLDGRVVGVNTAMVAGGTGIGFAIPINLAKVVEEELRVRGKVTRGFIGVSVQEMTADLARAFKLPRAEGALVGEVAPNGPAAKAAMKPGDVIVEWNGHKVAEGNRLPLLVAETPPGTRARATVVRDGKEVPLEVTVAELPADKEERDEERQPVAGHGGRHGLGVELRAVTPEIARSHGLPPGGVAVLDVDPDGAAAGRLFPGDIIVEADRKPARTPDDVKRAAGAAKGPLLLRVRRKDALLYVALPPRE